MKTELVWNFIITAKHFILWQPSSFQNKCKTLSKLNGKNAYSWRISALKFSAVGCFLICLPPNASFACQCKCFVNLSFYQEIFSLPHSNFIYILQCLKKHFSMYVHQSINKHSNDHTQNVFHLQRGITGSDCWPWCRDLWNVCSLTKRPGLQQQREARAHGMLLCSSPTSHHDNRSF